MAHMIYGLPQSLDGYVADLDGNITLPAPEEALHRHFNELTKNSALELYGRKMYEVMRYWDDPDPASSPWELEFAKLWQQTPKAVVSTTLTEVGPNATLIRDNIDTRLRALKAETQGTIQVAGPTLAATCTKLGLIDEYRLYFHPVVLGSGKPFFAGAMDEKIRYAGTEQLPQGVAMVRYVL